MKYKYINFESSIWGEIYKILPKSKKDKSEEKLLLVNSVLFLVENKEKYGLKLHWKQLENDGIKNICACADSNNAIDGKNVNVNSLRKKFNRWRDMGVWEMLLPIFDKYKEYHFVTNVGTYEVFLKCVKFANYKNKSEFQTSELNMQSVNAKNIDQKKLINEQKQKIQDLKADIKSGYCERAKKCDKNECDKKKMIKLRTNIKNLRKEMWDIKKEIGNLRKERRDFVIVQNKCIRRLIREGYDPARQKRPNQLMVDVFAEYKRTHNYPK